jgi:hypothetical protein
MTDGWKLFAKRVLCTLLLANSAMVIYEYQRISSLEAYIESIDSRTTEIVIPPPEETLEGISKRVAKLEKERVTKEDFHNEEQMRAAMDRVFWERTKHQ